MSLSVENKFIILDKTSTIKVEGDDRVQFLQGQLTQDINLVSQNNALYAGFCNPKSRMLAFMLCYSDQSTYKLIAPFRILYFKNLGCIFFAQKCR